MEFSQMVSSFTAEMIGDDIQFLLRRTDESYVVCSTGILPSPRSSHASAVLDHEFVVFGGEGLCAGVNKRESFSDLFMLNLKTWSWRPVPATAGRPHRLSPVASRGHTLSVVTSGLGETVARHGEEVQRNHRLVLFGGIGPDRGQSFLPPFLLSSVLQ